MAKHTSKEAYYERINKLAQSSKPSIKESNKRNLGSLIDYKRAANGIAYGIVKENHNYYLKKAGTKQDPNISDFVYIGGMENITGYQFKSLAEADKQRNMMFNTIGGAGSLKTNKTSSKMVLTEDLAGKEIEMAAEKIPDLDAATSAEAMPPAPEGGEEMTAGLDAKPMGDEETPEAAPDMGGMPPAEGGDGAPDMGGMPPAEGGALPTDDEMGDGAPDMGDGEMPTDDETGDGQIDTGEEADEPNKEIEKVIGKLTNKIRKTEMTDAQIKSYINSFITSFKDKLPDIEIEDRKDMANKLIKVVGQDEIDDLEASMPDDEKPVDLDMGADAEEEIDEQGCSECGGFAQYAESRGYTAESIKECGEEEMGNLVSGYANAHDEGENDGDHKSVALFIKLMPQVLDILRKEYGHDEYADELEPEVNSMDESTEEDLNTQINELFGGLKSLGKAAGSAISGAAKSVGQAIGNKAQQAGQAVSQAAGDVKQAVGQAATNVKQTYNKGEINNEVKKLEDVAAKLGQQVAALNKRVAGAGQEPINVQSLLGKITAGIQGGGTGDLSGFKNENTDPANTIVQPEMIKEEEEEIDDINIDDLNVGDENGEESAEEISTEETPVEKEDDNFFSPGSQSLGVATVKPNGAPTTGIDVNVDAENKTVNISVNEAIGKLRETLNALVNETKVGNKTPIMKGAKIVNEEKPSAGLSKEKKSEIVKKAKAGEDIGKKGKGFDKVADKAAKKYGSKEAGEKVAAAAMWKNAKKENAETEKEPISESEIKLRKYIRNRLEENTGLKKPMLSENKKSETLKKLDAVIDKQFKLFENVVTKK